MEITKETTVPQERILSIRSLVNNIEELKKLLNQSVLKDTTFLLEDILVGSNLLGASDIHFEPEENSVKFRLRIDGDLHDVFLFDKQKYKAILSRLKLLSGIKLNVIDRSQDGRFTVLLNKDKIETRVSSLPSEYGETVVIRILDPKSLVKADLLGIRKDMLTIFEKEIHQPNGMIIATGPTGSGKTTTLYAILKKIQSPEIKIITIEDPIEYHLDGISQSQVNPKKGYTFSTGLEAIVRQDPDVILVGEIRDSQTANIALQASLTGHLVLTTLHTNDAAGTIVRLMALGEKPVNIAPAINLVIGQRLVRKLCLACKEKKIASSNDLAFIKREINNLPTIVKKENDLVEIKEGLELPRPKGCSSCDNTGYRGRTGIFEFFLVDDELEIFIAQSPNVAQLREKAEEKGMVSMRQDGIIKVLQGITSLEEIKKATGS